MMRRRSLVSLILSVLLLGLGFTGAVSANSSNFRAHLSGDEEVPAVDTRATGQANFKFNETDGELEFKLIVANIDDVFAAHIHCGEFGVNGPVGVTLFGGETVSVNGILSQGTILAPDEGNACGWEDLEDVITAMESGGTYVNVHTTDNPGGEIRGQVR